MKTKQTTEKMSSDVVHEGDIFEEMGQRKKEMLSTAVLRCQCLLWQHSERLSGANSFRVIKPEIVIEIEIIMNYYYCLISEHVMILRRLFVDRSHNKLNNSNNNVLKSTLEVIFDLLKYIIQNIEHYKAFKLWNSRCCLNTKRMPHKLKILSRRTQQFCKT